jgi:hypothetical protein
MSRETSLRVDGQPRPRRRSPLWQLRDTMDYVPGIDASLMADFLGTRKATPGTHSFPNPGELDCTSQKRKS